jgi:hypothetical protein
MSQSLLSLYVEGRDDLYAIGDLLRRHQVNDSSTRTVEIKTSKGLNTEKTESVEALLDGMDFAIRQSRGRPTGFVFDADQEISSRWNAIVDRLKKTGFECPVSPVASGTVLTASIQGVSTTVGIWLMPNNADKGVLEDFLTELVQEGDQLLAHARTATDEAIRIDRQFPIVQRSKAVIHTWLAWQESPGLPFGTALTARYLRHDTPTALAFVAWFTQLFGIQPQVP